MEKRCSNKKNGKKRKKGYRLIAAPICIFFLDIEDVNRPYADAEDGKDAKELEVEGKEENKKMPKKHKKGFLSEKDSAFTSKRRLLFIENSTKAQCGSIAGIAHILSAREDIPDP